MHRHFPLPVVAFTLAPRGTRHSDMDTCREGPVTPDGMRAPCCDARRSLSATVPLTRIILLIAHGTGADSQDWGIVTDAMCAKAQAWFPSPPALPCAQGAHRKGVGTLTPRTSRPGSPMPPQSACTTLRHWQCGHGCRAGVCGLVHGHISWKQI